ncbi:MAG: phospho-N-acetylmuramoyl-pentapeptide-transferase [Sphaerochaeta sp.]|nr:phospho-N-acetylmuramoyl-pentapeptide-transferase [Sphaerochaeta sp.]
MPRPVLLFFFSALLTWLLSLLLLRHSRVGAIIKEELLSTQMDKGGTPVVGGIAFGLATLIVSLFDPDRGDPLLFIPLATMVLFGLIGLVDDRAKARSSSADGLPSLVKLALQWAGAIALLILLSRSSYADTSVDIFTVNLNLGWWYYPLALCYLLFFVNAVNITDGLDSLAAGSSIPLLLLIVAVSFKRGYTPSTALLGAVSVFLLFNAHPARYFMGDAGSHMLGSYIAIQALMLKAEVLILCAGGLFLVELATSLIQIISIRRFGRKAFTIAPLHHAYELKGMGERTIVRRFIVASWVCGAISLIILW